MPGTVLRVLLVPSQLFRIDLILILPVRKLRLGKFKVAHEAAKQGFESGLSAKLLCHPQWMLTNLLNEC